MTQLQTQAPAPKQAAPSSAMPSLEGETFEAMPLTVQRSLDNLQQLSPQNMMYLQRSIGNIAVQQLLEPRRGKAITQPHPIVQRTAPTIQAQLAVGPADDKYDREADAVSKQVVHRAAIARVQRVVSDQPVVGMEGGSLDSDIEGRIRRSSSGGSSMPEGVRRAIEPTLGADLSSVKVHTDSHSASLNRQLGAKAFTHKNHIYYGAGQSPKDIQLTAHEAVHTIQQGATSVNRKPKTDALQRIYQHPDNNKYYSHALPRQEITSSTGVVTASATGGLGGGHTILVFEVLDGSRATNYKVDLTAGGVNMSSGKESGSGGDKSQSTTEGSVMSENVSSGSTGSQGTSTSEIQINIGEASENSMLRLAKAQKRSWVVSNDKIAAGLQEARAVQQDMRDNTTKYKYKLFGRGIFTKNPMNCASFGERVLQKAGIKASATSWWFGAKLPSTLASGANVGYTPDSSWTEPVAKPKPTTSTPTTPTPPRVDTSEYDHITQVAIRRPVFSEGKMIAGDLAPFDPKGAGTKVFTFRSVVTGELDLPLQLFRLLVEKDTGMAKLELPSGTQKYMYVYVKLTDIFNSSGALITS